MSGTSIVQHFATIYLIYIFPLVEGGRNCLSSLTCHVTVSENRKPNSRPVSSRKLGVVVQQVRMGTRAPNPNDFLTISNDFVTINKNRPSRFIKCPGADDGFPVPWTKTINETRRKCNETKRNYNENLVSANDDFRCNFRINDIVIKLTISKFRVKTRRFSRSPFFKEDRLK